MPNETVKETLLGLFEATSVPADKQEEFASIFEAAVAVEAKAKAAELTEAVTAQAEADKAALQEKMNEYSEYLIEEYATKLDQYLDYATDKLFKENKLAITNGVKAGLFDSLVEGIKGVVHEHGINITDEQVDVVSELEESLAEANTQLNTEKHEVIALRSELAKMNKTFALNEATDKLTQTQKERVIALAEEINYDETFANKLSTIVEAVTATIAPPAAPITQEPIQLLPENITKKANMKNICKM